MFLKSSQLQPPVSSPYPVESLVARLAVFVIIAAVIGTLGLAGWLVFGGVPNVRGVENNVVFGIQQILLGHPLYSDPAHFPFQIIQYNPLYYYLCVWVAKLSGVGVDDVYGLYVITRGVSALLELARLALIYWVLRRILKVDRGPTLLACAIIFICTAPWNFLARPDSVQAVCFLAAIVCTLQMYANATERPRSSDAFLVLAVIFGCAATMAKQNGFAFLLILLSFFLLTGDWRRLFLGAAVALVGGVGCLALAAQCGPALWANVVDGVRNGYDYADAFVKTYQPFLSTLPLLVALSVFISIRWLRSSTNRSEQFLAYTTVTLFLLASLLGFKYGSTSQYYNDYLVVAVLAACSYYRPIAAASRREIARMDGFPVLWSVTCACVLAMSLGNHLYGCIYRPLTRPSDGGTLRDREEVRVFLSAELQNHPGTFLFSFDSMTVILFPDRSVLPQKDVIEINYDRRIWDNAAFASLVASGKVRYLVAPNRELPRSYVGVPLDDYVKLRTCGKFSVYVWQGK